MPKLKHSATEALTTKVYGDTFALYNQQQFEDFLLPLEIRFRRNNIDPKVFEGKRCLDAGCGGGRGSIFMARHGATEVVGIDLSEKNIATSTFRANHSGYTNLHFHQGTLEKLSLDDQTFDIVWCNGVLHHSDHPNSGLEEISRVLRVGGHMWLYLYGSGGLYWNMVDWIRRELIDTTSSSCMALMLAWNVPIGRIAEFIDDWFVPWLRRYQPADVSAKLQSLGFSNPELLRRGTDYDTSERVFILGEKDYWGCGDVRYFVQKTEHRADHRIQLPDHNRKGSFYTDSDLVHEVGATYIQLTQSLDMLSKHDWQGNSLSLKVGLFRTIQTYLRDLMSQPGPFPIESYRAFLIEQQTRLSLIDE